MPEDPVTTATTTLLDGMVALRVAASPPASADARIAAVVACEALGQALGRRLEVLSMELMAGLDRDGTFTERGYARPAGAVADLLGWDLGQAARRVRVAEQVCARRGLGGQVLAPLLPSTAAAFSAGQLGLRHAEVITEALATPAAGRLTPEGVGRGGGDPRRTRRVLPAAGAGLLRPPPHRGPRRGRPGSG